MSAPYLRTCLLALLAAVTVVSAQTSASAIVYPTTVAASATTLPSAYGYTYAGCWNETIDVANSGGVRALSDGMEVRLRELERLLA